MYNSIAMFIGHLVGDYIFQSDWMAVNKSKPGWRGRMACDVHVFIYSVCVAVCVVLGGWRVWVFNDYHSAVLSGFIAMAIATIAHYPIDRWGLAGKWMKFYGNTLPDKLKGVYVEPRHPTDQGSVFVYIGPRQYFWAPVYIVIDNTMHLVLMWIGFSLAGSVIG